MKIGDKVRWFHKPKIIKGMSHYSQEMFEAKGEILDIFTSTRGGGAMKVKKCAKIKLRFHPYWKKIGYTTTCINLDKLHKINE